MLLCGLTMEALFIGLVWLGNLRQQVPLFWSLVFPACGLYLAAVTCRWRRPCGALWPVLGLAVLFRCTMLWSPPTLSDDIFRYVWDGRQQAAGINPYLHPPQAAAVAHLRDDLYLGINNKDIPTIYPPLAQFFFRTVVAINPSLLSMKAAFVLCDLALILLLVQILRQRQLDPGRVLFYAWNPLPIIEIAGSGHIDILGVLCLWTALYALTTGKRLQAVVALAGAFLGKLVPALLLPFFWRQLGPSQGTFYQRWLAVKSRIILLWFPLICIAGFAPFISAGPQIFGGLQTYLLKWRFNDAAFGLFYLLLKTPELTWDENALHGAKTLSSALLLLILLWSLTRHKDAYYAAFVALGAYLLLSPTLHPWYLLWVLPFLVLFPRPSWLVFSSLVFLAYQVLIEYSKRGLWQEHAWVLWLEYTPFYLLLALELWLLRACSRAPFWLRPAAIEGDGVALSRHI